MTGNNEPTIYPNVVRTICIKLHITNYNISAVCLKDNKERICMEAAEYYIKHTILCNINAVGKVHVHILAC